MPEAGSEWRNTTHDWARSVDAQHLAGIRAKPDVFAPCGAMHLVLEVLAYAADEAQSAGNGSCAVILNEDGSISITDNGRGTDTRTDEHGRAIKKPVMTTKDLRFFDDPSAEALPDGHPRRGMSVVAALSEWLIHTNRRSNGVWRQRYEHGVPVTDLERLVPDGIAGTTVQFQPSRMIDKLCAADVADLTALRRWPDLAIDVIDHR